MPPRKESYFYPGMLHELDNLPQATSFWKEFGMIVDREGAITPWKKQPTVAESEGRQEFIFGETPLAADIRFIRHPNYVYSLLLNEITPAYARVLNLALERDYFAEGDRVELVQSVETLTQQPTLRILRGEQSGEINQLSSRFIRSMMFTAGAFDVRSHADLQKQHGEFVNDLTKGKGLFGLGRKEVTADITPGIEWQQIAHVYADVLSGDYRALELYDPHQLAPIAREMQRMLGGTETISLENVRYAENKGELVAAFVWSSKSESGGQPRRKELFTYTTHDHGFNLAMSDDVFSSLDALALTRQGLEAIRVGGTTREQQELLRDFTEHLKIKGKFVGNRPVSWNVPETALSGIQNLLHSVVGTNLRVKGVQCWGHPAADIAVGFSLEDQDTKLFYDVSFSMPVGRILRSEAARLNFTFNSPESRLREEWAPYGFDGPLGNTLLSLLTQILKSED